MQNTSNVTHGPSGLPANNPGKSLPSGWTVSGLTGSDPIFDLRSWPSKNFTVPGCTKISRLFRAIEFSGLLPYSVSAYAMPLQVTSGADDAAVLRCSGNTGEIITLFGTLLLQLAGEVDATTVAYLTSFIKERTEELVNMNPEEESRLKELEDESLMVQTLSSISQESKDPDSVRMAYSALINTKSGVEYLKERGYKL